MRRFRACLTAAAAVAVLGLPPAQPARALDLSTALARARTASPTIRTARAAVEAANGRLVQAGVWAPANPVLGTSLARHTGDAPTDIDREVSLAQEVEIGGQRGLRLGAARYDVAHAEALLADAERGVDAEVRRAFAELAAAARRRALAAEVETLAARTVDAARRRAQAGDIPALDVHLAEVEAVRAARAIGMAEVDRLRAAARLATAIGAPADERLTAETGDDDPVPLPDETRLLAHALDTRPDLAAAKAERARLDGEATLLRRQGAVPNPVVRGFYRHEFGDEHIAGGEVSLPLPLWNREQGTQIAARATATAAGADVERLERQIPRDVMLALARRATAAEAWARYRRDVVPAERSAGTLLDRALAGGAIGLPDALVAQTRLRDARAGGIDAWLELRTAEADLIEAAGGSLP